MGIDKSTKTRVPQRIPKSIMALVENYWHKHRLANRSVAIQVLIEKGLASSETYDQSSEILRDSEYSKISLTLSNDLIDGINLFQHNNHIKNRTVAILILIMTGIENDK